MNSTKFFMGFILSCFLSVPALAEQKAQKSDPLTITEMMRNTYMSNPSLRASRAELRALHELYPQALAGWRPTLSAEASIYATDIENSNFGNGDGATTKDMSLNLDQPLFRGGRTIAETERAKNLIKAGYATLLQTEQSVILEALTATLNVIRDRSLVDLYLRNETILQEELTATSEKMKAGELTKTDVGQAEARLAQSRANRIAAQSDLDTSMAEFEEIVGYTPPQNLDISEWTAVLPAAQDEALQLADQNNPAIHIAEFQHEAAQDDIDARTRELFPQLFAFASYNKQYDPQPGIIDESQTETIGLRASIPLYEAGSVRSRVRQAKNIANQRDIEVTEARRQIRMETISNWKNLRAAEAEMRAREAEIKAARSAWEGIREETRMGARTVLDLLNTEQQLRDAESALVEARRNASLFSYALLANMGQLVPERVGLADVAYDPGDHYRTVSRKIFSMDGEIDR